MTQITEDYVSYEIAKLLKEKGFEQECDYATSWYAAEYYKSPCVGEWFEGERIIIKDIDDKCAISYLYDSVFIPAPALSIALKWLREVHKINIVINVASDDNNLYSLWKFDIWNGNYSIIWGDKREKFNSYEEACEAALLYVLKNLI